MIPLRNYAFSFSLTIASLLFLGFNSCSGGGSYKDASDYESERDSTYDYTTDSIIYSTPSSFDDSLTLPSLSKFENAILIHGYSWWNGFEYRCIVSSQDEKKLQIIFRDLSTPDSIYKFKYHEKQLTTDEYNLIAKLILKKNIPNFPFDLEKGRGKHMTDADTYLISIKEGDFFKTTIWRVNDDEDKKKESTHQIHQLILKLSGYPLPKPYVKLKPSYDSLMGCKVGVYDNGLHPDYRVSYKGTLLEKEDTAWHYELSLPPSAIRQLKEDLVFVAKFEDGDEVTLQGLEIDSTKLMGNQ